MRSACIVLDLLRVIAVAILGRGDRLDPGRIFFVPPDPPWFYLVKSGSCATLIGREDSIES